MLGNIVKWTAVILCSIIVGWVLCLIFQDISPYTLDWEIGMAEILAIVIEIVIACVIAQILEKNMNNTRFEKDYFIAELEAVNEIYSELEKTCAKETTLSLSNINYDIGRSRKVLHRMWKMIGEVKNAYRKHLKNDYDELISTIKALDKQLTDATTFKREDGFEPIKIARNHIYLNGSIKPSIDSSVSKIKELVLKLKIEINQQ